MSCQSSAEIIMAPLSLMLCVRYLQQNLTAVPYLSFRSPGDLFLPNVPCPFFLILEYQLVYRWGQILFHCDLFFGLKCLHHINYWRQRICVTRATGKGYGSICTVCRNFLCALRYYFILMERPVTATRKAKSYFSYSCHLFCQNSSGHVFGTAVIFPELEL